MTWRRFDITKTWLRLWLRSFQPKRNRTPYRRFGRPFLEALENRLAPAAVSWTGADNNLQWGDPLNWKNTATGATGVPGSTDDATINIAVNGTITVSPYNNNNSYSVRSLNDTTASLAITSGTTLTLTPVAAAATSTLGQNVTVQSGGTLAVGAGANVQIGVGAFNTEVTLADDGTLTFASGDIVNFDNSTNQGIPTQIVVGNGGLMTANGTAFTSAGGTTLIDVNAGELRLNGGSIDLSNLLLDSGSTDTIQLVRFLSPLAINSGAIINNQSRISWNDFSNLGTNNIVASGDPNATINLDNNYWGSADPTQIVDDHSKNALLPTVSYQPFLTARPVQTVPAAVSTPYNPGAQNVTLSADLASPSGTVSEGSVTFTILKGTTVIGTPVQANVSAGQASATYALPAGLTAGAYNIAVSYSDSAGNFIDVSDVDAVLTIAQVQTSTALSSSATSTNFGTPVTFTAKVTVPPPGAGTPTGTVAFKDGSTVLGSSPLQVVNGVDEAMFTTSSLPAGSDAITAVYSGDSNFLTSTSSVVNQTVLPVYVVTSTADDGSFGTLRYGINQADAVGSAVTIDFNIGTAGSAQKISLSSQLPALTASGVYINGLSQGGSGNTTRLITLNGTGAGTGSDGLLLQGSGEQVSGLIIENFSKNGIEVAGSSSTIGGTTTGAGNVVSGNGNDGVLIDSGVSGILVDGNILGLDATGTTALANSGNGLEVQGTNNTIGGGFLAARNYISGNGKDGVLLGASASGNLVLDGFIGLNSSGTVGVGNLNGVEIAGSSNTLGSTAGGGFNYISGNSGDGVLIDSTAKNNLVQNNFVGLDTSNQKAIANSIGIEVAGVGTTIGGTASGARNIVAASKSDGIKLDSTGSGTVLLGNSIGINAANAALGNGGNGLNILSSSNTIGGTASAARNIISANANDGILLASGANSNLVLNNFIGVDLTGSKALANSANGIEIASTANTIGGTASGSLNQISGNTNDGVLLDSTASGNQILGNYIGINHAGSAALANKVGIEDAGSSNTIGGSVLTARNYISGNSGDGVLLDSTASSDLIGANFIGLNPSGSAAMANGSNGVEIQGSKSTIGGSVLAARNYISGNSNDGVLI